MSNFLMKTAEPRDIIALILMLGYIFAVILGKATELQPIVLLVVGFYFGTEHQKVLNNIENV